MMSESQVAQENLAKLEKDSAPFEDQLREAAKFIGVDLEDVGRSLAQNLGQLSEARVAAYHGREEWLLRWLLKKLQAPNDDVPRKNTDSWILFCYLIRAMPLPNAARMLSEKKFTTILRQTLEEAAQRIASGESEAENTPKVSLEYKNKSLKASKKRKRSGEFVATDGGPEHHKTQNLPTAIFTTIYQIILFTRVTSVISEGGRTAAFSAEYMKSVIRTPAEDAAKILGSWLSLCQTSLQKTQSLDMGSMNLWLSPFIEIWDSRIVGSDDLGQFSLYCSQPVLSLLKAVNARDAAVEWKDVLEQLVARNMIIPAKVARTANVESELLDSFTRISVIQDSANASILFEIATRLIQAQGPQRRRANDSWLQYVFTTLKAAMPPQRTKENGKAIREMLQSAIKYKIDLGLPTLHSVTSEYCMLEGGTNWDLSGIVIKLDANVFLIPNEEKDLLQELLPRITAACFEPSWRELSGAIISNVLIPLMNGFAKARDLSGFIRHWYAELVEFERRRKEDHLSSIAVFSAWEDEAVQSQFFKIMEASLTVTQITHLLDWLSSQVMENPDAVCVILEAMAGSITQAEFSDAVGLRLYDIMFNDAASERLDGRYKWRTWRILSRMLNWDSPPETDLEEISDLWEESALPFDTLSNKFSTDSLLDVVNVNKVELENIEAIRFACAAWKVSTKDGRLMDLCRKPVVDILRSLAEDIKLIQRDLAGVRDLGNEDCNSTLNTLYRGIGWMLWTCLHCVFVEYPEVLQLGFDLKGDSFKEFLQTVFWIASVSSNESSSNVSNPWLRMNANAFPSIWTSILNNDLILNDKALIGMIIDIMLSSETNKGNILTGLPRNNAFSVQCLLDIPLEVFSRKYRERIMKNWLPSNKDAAEDLSESVVLDPAVLGLKVKMMQRHTVYDGMKYQDLANLADALASTKLDDTDMSLSSFKELVKRTISHISADLGQTRNREYAIDALKHLRKKTKTKSDNKKSHTLNFSLIALFEVLIETFAIKETQLSDLDIISSADFTDVKNSFKRRLIAQLEGLLTKTKKSSKAEKQVEKSLTILSTIDALAKLAVDRSDLVNAMETAKSFTASVGEADREVGKRLDNFMSTHSRPVDWEVTDTDFRGDPSTVYGRRAIKESVHARMTGSNQHQKLALLKCVLENRESSLSQLDKLLAMRYIIGACEDSRQSSDDEDKDDSFDLSTAYATFSSRLWKSTTVRQFSLISETMALMLRTKNRAMNQWNIDSTLGSITIICSRNGPRLRPTRAGTIFTSLCQLLQMLLTSHRLKLEGHFHLVVQAMQALLRCLFTPLPHATSKASKFFTPPPWLSSPKNQLNSTHAAAFTRLVTLICDPSVSSVTRSKQNQLISATDKAKRMASQHMQFLLILYIQLQLEMKMLPEIREKMVPGLYAIFDTTTWEIRRVIGDSLDSSGRAIFGTLFRDYQQFGKWKGA